MVRKKLHKWIKIGFLVASIQINKINNWVLVWKKKQYFSVFFSIFKKNNVLRSIIIDNQVLLSNCWWKEYEQMSEWNVCDLNCFG